MIFGDSDVFNDVGDKLIKTVRPQGHENWALNMKLRLWVIEEM